MVNISVDSIAVLDSIVTNASVVDTSIVGAVMVVEYGHCTATISYCTCLL